MESLSWYGYDSLDRITTGNETSTTSGWTYDANGNRLTQDGGAAPAYSASSIVGVYNNRGRLATMTAGTMTTAYVYNALGQRVEKAGATALLYMYDESGHRLGEYTSAGVLIEESIWLGVLPVATLRPNGSGISVYYIHADHLGSPKMITRPTSTSFGSSSWRCTSSTSMFAHASLTAALTRTSPL
jgi:YD repeat-containing protein